MSIQKRYKHAMRDRGTLRHCKPCGDIVLLTHRQDSRASLFFVPTTCDSVIPERRPKIKEFRCHLLRIQVIYSGLDTNFTYPPLNT